MVGKPGPVLLGLGSIEPGGGFREGHYKTFGGECPEKLMLHPGDIYVALKGATKDGSMIGSVARVPLSVESGRLTQDTAKLEFTAPDLDIQRYLYWVLRTPHYREYCASRQRGTTAAALGRDDFLAYPVPGLTWARQRLAHLLDNLEAKIELNRQTSQTLEPMARALFKSWFVDFDPVRAKADGRDTYLASEIAGHFPGSFEESKIGVIPRGWGIRRLGDFVTLDKGLSYKGAYLGETGMAMVNLGCFPGQGRFSQQAIKHYSGNSAFRHRVRPGDLVVANTDITQKREVLGSAALVSPQVNADELLFTHHVFAVRFRPDNEHWKLFTYFALLQDAYRERVTGFATGTTVLALPRDALLELRVVDPPELLVRAFGRAVSPLLERHWRAESQSSVLEAMRDELLSELQPGSGQTLASSGDTLGVVA
jgi:type I restriction enzyme S subunit